MQDIQKKNKMNFFEEAVFNIGKSQTFFFKNLPKLEKLIEIKNILALVGHNTYD